MSEAPDRESKTEQATEKKVRDAVEKGNLPVSREAAVMASLLGMLAASTFLLPAGVSQVRGSLERFIDDPADFPLANSQDAVALFTMVGAEAAVFIMPIVIGLALAGLAASFLQNTPRFVATRIQPKGSNISLQKGFERIFGMRGQVEFLKSLLKLIAVIAISAVLFQSTQTDIINAMQMEPAAVPQLVLDVAIRILTTLTIAAAALVAADLAWSRFAWARDLRMTKQEVKDEHKQMDGDPILKARMRSVARDRIRRRMIAAVPRATLVIANPTHYAIALRYVRNETAAPIVLAKGQDLIALKIREIAEEHGIPVIEDKDLARSLYKVVEIDRQIPQEFFKAVAELILYLSARGNSQKRSLN